MATRVKDIKINGRNVDYPKNPTSQAFSLAVVGTGAVGAEIARFAYTAQERGRDIFTIKRLFLYNGDNIARARSVESKLLTISGMPKYSAIESKLKVTTNLDEIKDESDIIVISMDAAKGQVTKREELLEHNLDPIIYISQKLKNFKGHIVMVSNPVDELAFACNVYSNAKVEGENGVDQLRLKRAIKEELEEKIGYAGEIEALVVGRHSEPVPIFSNTYVEDIPIRALQISGMLDYEGITNRFRGYGDEERKASGEHPSQDVVEVVIEHIAKILDSKNRDTSTLIKLKDDGNFRSNPYAHKLERDKGFYTGWRVNGDGSKKALKFDEEEREPVYNSYQNGVKLLRDIIETKIREDSRKKSRYATLIDRLNNKGWLDNIGVLFL